MPFTPMLMGGKMSKAGADPLRLKRKGSEKEDFMRIKELIAQK
jgi:hypothetical protein